MQEVSVSGGTIVLLKLNRNTLLAQANAVLNNEVGKENLHFNNHYRLSDLNFSFTQCLCFVAKVWENMKTLWKHWSTAHVHISVLVLPNFPKCRYNSKQKTFYFKQKKTMLDHNSKQQQDF